MRLPRVARNDTKLRLPRRYAPRNDNSLLLQMKRGNFANVSLRATRGNPVRYKRIFLMRMPCIVRNATKLSCRENYYPSYLLSREISRAFVIGL